MKVSNNYSNQQTFGMAFKKPNPETRQFIKNMVKELKPNDQEKFFETFQKHVDGAKDCPVDIEMIGKPRTELKPDIGFFVNGKKMCSGFTANGVLECMKQAAAKAKEISNKTFDKKMDDLFEIMS